MSRQNNIHRGFTLVELLVVIGIIALLISILIPVLNKAKSAAHSAACQSNLKQLMTAFLMFANDHRSALPGNKHDCDAQATSRFGRPWPQDWKTDWLMGRDDYGQQSSKLNAPVNGTIYGYLKNKKVYTCPAETLDGVYGTGGGSNQRFDYTVFGSLAGAKINMVQKMTIVKMADREITIITPVIVQEYPTSVNQANIEGGHSMSDRMAVIHNGGSYYATLDGSAQFFREDYANLRNPSGASNCYVQRFGTVEIQMGQDWSFGDWAYARTGAPLPRGSLP